MSFGTWGFKSPLAHQLMPSRLAAALLLLGAFLVGGIAGAVFFGDVGEKPCWQVTQDLEPVRDTVARTFGGGEEGRAALATMRDASQRRPDCFPPSARELYNLEPDDTGTDFSTGSTTTESPGG